MILHGVIHEDECAGDYHCSCRAIRERRSQQIPEREHPHWEWLMGPAEPVTGRGLLASTFCPACGQVVYLGDVRDVRDVLDIPVAEDITAPEVPVWFRPRECRHLGPDGVHRWTTTGVIEIRPATWLRIVPR